MINCPTNSTAEAGYLKAPRFIDHHLAPGRSIQEVHQAKGMIKKIICYCIDLYQNQKRVIDLTMTEHIEKAFIRLLANFAQDDPNFIMVHPNRILYQRLVDNGFPATNIWRDAAQSGSVSACTSISL